MLRILPGCGSLIKKLPMENKTSPKVLPVSVFEIDESVSKSLLDGIKLTFAVVFPTDLSGVLLQRIVRAENVIGDSSRVIAFCRFIDLNYKPTNEFVMVFASSDLMNFIRYQLIDGSDGVEE